MSDTINEKKSSSKKRLIVGIIVLAIIGSGIFVLKRRISKSEEPDTNSIISEVEVKEIHFKDTSLSLKVGETVTLEIIAEPNDSEDIEYKSNDPAIAEVDAHGNLTGTAPGNTSVTATLKSNNSITATIDVTVLDNTDTDINENKKQTDKDTDTDTDVKHKNTSSTTTSSKPDSDKEKVSSAVSSTVSKAENSSSSTNVSQLGNYTSTNQSNGDTSPTNNVENTPNETREQTNSETETTTNNTSEFIDPSSVGKSTPISYVGTKEKKVSISFDASWGNDKTQLILDTLDQYDVKATFFLVGIWVREYPDDVKNIANAGHDIGNHSNTHPDLTQLNMASIRYEIETCNSDIEKLTGKRPTLFRNPFGAYDDRVVGTVLGMGMDCIQWDVDTLDWTNNSGAEICARIRNNIKNGSIILMHNAGGSTADSLPMIIQTIQDLGYEIVPISELIPEGDYTTDFSGRLIPQNPPENDTTDSFEDTENTVSENEQSQQTVNSTDTNDSESDLSSNNNTDN